MMCLSLSGTGHRAMAVMLRLLLEHLLRGLQVGLFACRVGQGRTLVQVDR